MNSSNHGEPELNKLFRIARKHGASSLTLAVDQRPVVRLRGELRRLNLPSLNDENIASLVKEIMTAETAAALQTNGSVDFDYEVGKQECCFCCRVSMEQGKLGLYARPVEAMNPR